MKRRPTRCLGQFLDAQVFEITSGHMLGMREGDLDFFAVTGYDRLRPYFVDALVNSTHSMHSSRRMAGPLWGCWSNEQPSKP